MALSLSLGDRSESIKTAVLNANAMAMIAMAVQAIPIYLILRDILLTAATTYELIKNQSNLLHNVILAKEWNKLFRFDTVGYRMKQALFMNGKQIVSHLVVAVACMAIGFWLGNTQYPQDSSVELEQQR
tara:strand:+ start:34 stop:420 length:387 start_codon:yes stop_codon:yes gene_type:complete